MTRHLDPHFFNDHQTELTENTVSKDNARIGLSSLIEALAELKESLEYNLLIKELRTITAQAKGHDSDDYLCQKLFLEAHKILTNASKIPDELFYVKKQFDDALTPRKNSRTVR